MRQGGRAFQFPRPYGNVNKHSHLFRIEVRLSSLPSVCSSTVHGVSALSLPFPPDAQNDAVSAVSLEGCKFLR